MNTLAIDYDARDRADISDTAKMLVKNAKFITEALENADFETLVAHYQCGADLRPQITLIVREWFDRCAEHAIAKNAEECRKSCESPSVYHAMQHMESLYQ